MNILDDPLRGEGVTRSAFIIKPQCHQSPEHSCAISCVINQIQNRESEKTERRILVFHLKKQVIRQNSFSFSYHQVSELSFRISYLDPFLGPNRSLNFASISDIYRFKVLLSRQEVARWLIIDSFLFLLLLLCCSTSPIHKCN